jgi:hypothetical protein
MILYQTTFVVPNLRAGDVTEFMVNCNDQQYQNWWKGVHVAFHTMKRFAANVGNLVVFDEYVGEHRLKFKAVLERYEPETAMVWRMKKVILLPAWLRLSLENVSEGVQITHSVRIGFGGQKGILDRLIQAFLPKDLEQELAKHAVQEFTQLRDFLDLEQPGIRRGAGRNITR